MALPRRARTSRRSARCDEPNIAIVTAYNDMLSAHQPYGRYPEAIKIYAREAGATAQVAGGVAAMCDGVTQGQPGMDLSLFSRDTIALSTAVALSHGMFEGIALLGICDKIVPGLLIGALRFGHLPALLIPGGPMPSGLANKEKQRVRQLFAEGKVGKEELLAAEAASYHGAGTCTFYGTAALIRVLEVRQGDGTFVTSLDPALLMETMGFVLDLHQDASVLEFFEVRRILEPAAAARAALRMADADIATLRKLLDELGPEPSVEDLLASDVKFHRLLAIGSGNRALASIIDSLRQPTYRARIWRGLYPERRRSAGRWPNTGRSSTRSRGANRRWPGPGRRCTSPASNARSRKRSILMTWRKLQQDGGRHRQRQLEC